MNEWLQEVIRALNLGEVTQGVSESDLKAILDAARHAAHQVERPAAPVTTYLMGMAVARGGDIQEISDTIEALAQAWAQKDS
jgi:hypothetical protein